MGENEPQHFEGDVVEVRPHLPMTNARGMTAKEHVPVMAQAAPGGVVAADREVEVLEAAKTALQQPLVLQSIPLVWLLRI